MGQDLEEPVACSLLNCCQRERNMTSRSSTADEIADTARIPVCDFAIGEVIDGKYRVEAAVAEGGMGVVLRATHIELDCSVALKVIRPAHAANEEVVARLLSEARIAASLHSKHVNRVLDVGRTVTGVPYLVLEYMTGTDLCSYLARRGAMPVSEAVDYVLQACEALAEAHAIGIVHRDLKPENLFLSEEADGGFVLKVLDFGISKAPPRRGIQSVITNPFEIIGSPTYMSPEQVRGTGVDARADIWALGTVLHELCTGEKLFEASTMTDTFAKILDESYLPSVYGAGAAAALLHQVVCRCLRRNADERYASVVELARQLAPLGTDALQAARVAKVATASRARLIGASAGEDLETAATPLAVTRSESETSIAAALPRQFGRWLLVGAAAVLPIIVGVGYLARPGGLQRASLAAPPTVAPAIAAVPPTADVALSPAPALDIALPSAPVVELAPAPALGAALRRAPTAPATLRWTPPPPRFVVSAPQRPGAPAPLRPAPERAPAAPAPSAAASAESQAVADPWNPKTFGGRR